MGNWALLLELSEKAPRKKVPKLLSPSLKTCLSHETKMNGNFKRNRRMVVYDTVELFAQMKLD